MNTSMALRCNTLLAVCRGCAQTCLIQPQYFRLVVAPSFS